ncbi:MAG: radical SAM protein, partial [Verrucomicrobia bacterium]|nr:radical SAM protein [Verrucomicrobiota bacterium]
MCKIWEHPTRKSEEITPDILDKIPDNFLDRINLTGGEPTIRDDIEELVRVLRKKAKLVELSTNGYFTERVVRVADKYPDIMVRVSVEGLPALNDKWRGTKDGFDHALRTMLELKKTRAKNIGFSVVIHDGNATDLLSLYELCTYLGVEFGNSTMHNSWFFCTTENQIHNVPLAVETEKQFIRALLRSRRPGVKLRVKDWLRAYFNLNILQHLQGKSNLLRG